jgi:hypothetical protein
MTMLNEKAMLITLNITHCTTRAGDKDVTEQVLRAHGADDKAGAFSKELISKDHIGAVKKLEGQARNYLREKTLPWLDNGQRILPARLYTEVIQDLGKIKAEWETAVNDFLGQYDQVKRLARARLGRLYKDDDFPSVVDMEKKFKFDFSFLPMPDAGDFRIADKKVVEQIKAQAEQQIKETLQHSVNDLFVRINKVLTEVVKIKDPDKIFRDSLIGNVQSLVETLPALNLTDDPELNKLAKELGAKIAETTAEDLRKDKKKRAQVAKDAETLLDRVKGYV